MQNVRYQAISVLCVMHLMFVNGKKGVTTMQNELKPCPFCGGKAILKEKYIKGVANRKNYWVVCTKCQTRTQDRNRVCKALEEWNRRFDNAE